MRTLAGIPLDCNPLLTPGVDALRGWLVDAHYSEHAIGRIARYTAAQGTPTGAPMLEAEDEAGATEAFVAGLPDRFPAELPAVAGGAEDLNAWLDELEAGYPPDDQAEPEDWPREKTTADRRRDWDDVLEYYREHPIR
jgi:hypothetical protein